MNYCNFMFISEIYIVDETMAVKENIGDEENDGKDQDGEDEEKSDTEKEEKSENEEDAQDEETENKKTEEEEENHIPVDFYYNFEELVSKPMVAQDSGLPLNMLELK